MKNTIKRVLCFLLVVSMTLGAFTSCKWFKKPTPDGGGTSDGTDNGDEGGTGSEGDDYIPEDEPIVEPPLPVIDGKNIVSNGTTDYEILIPAGCGDMVSIAATEIVYFFGEATGITLNIVTEPTPGKKVISLGATSVFADSGIDLAPMNLTSQGFHIATVGDSVLICGNGDYAILWGAYELVTRLFNYEYYVNNFYVIDRNVANVPLYDFSLTEIPSFDGRMICDAFGYDDSEMTHRRRMQRAYSEYFISPESNFCHNSFYYLEDENGVIDPRFLATSGQQLCYTAHGNPDDYKEMVATALKFLISQVEANPTFENIMMGMQDQSGNWCKCSGCTEAKEKYGADSGAVCVFMNDLYDGLMNYFAENNIDRELHLIFFAYNDITQPPVQKDADGNYVCHPDVILRDGVGIMYAPIQMDFFEPISGDKNSTYIEYLEMFEYINARLYVWAYGINFSYYLAPYDSFSNQQELYQTMLEHGAVFMMNQCGQRNGVSSHFDVVRAYISDKLLWDVNADVNQLTDQFFDDYFGPASDTMRQFFDEFQTRIVYNHDVLGMSGGVYADTIKEKYYPMQLLNTWIAYCEQAFEDIAPLKETDPDLYKAYYDHIMLESLTPRYLLLKLYVTSGESADQMIEQFVNDAMSVGMMRFSESGSLDF